MSADEIKIDVKANVHPVFQKPLAPDPNQTKFEAELQLKPVFQKWLNTDLRFKDPLSADIAFNEAAFRQENARLRNVLVQSLKDIQIGLKPGNSASIFKEIDEIFKKQPVKLFDKDTRIDKQSLTAYLKRYVKELETLLKQAPPNIQAKLTFDLQKLKDDLRTVQATLNVGLEPDLSKVQESFDKVSQTLAKSMKTDN